jgi:hypothetical protein
MREPAPFSLQKCSHKPDSGHFSPVRKNLRFLACLTFSAFEVEWAMVFGACFFAAFFAGMTVQPLMVSGLPL